MIFFRDQQWLKVNSATRFRAYIDGKKRTSEDVHWSIELRFVATGPQYRRVDMYARPNLWINLSGFKSKLQSWTELERLNYWNLEAANDDPLAAFDAGFLDVDYHPSKDPTKVERSGPSETIWRVAGREGGFFLFELAGFADGRSILDALTQQPVAVTPDGREEKVEPDPEFWKKHGELYIAEHVPFGTVTVRVPRNARDVVEYAMARAQQLIGTGQPEHVELNDFAPHSEPASDMAQDIWVKLHFNGYYEDH